MQLTAAMFLLGLLYQDLIFPEARVTELCAGYYRIYTDSARGKVGKSGDVLFTLQF